MAPRKKGKIGSSFDDFLAEQGILQECEERAIKQILADQIKAAMNKDCLTKAAMAARMQTSRRALDRLLDPKILESPYTRCNAPRSPLAANSVLSWSDPSGFSTTGEVRYSVGVRVR